MEKQTFPIMHSAGKLNGILFCIMIFGMFLYSLPLTYTFFTKHEDTYSLFIDGKLIRKFENYYDKKIFIHEPSVKIWASLRFIVFDEGTSGVIIGNSGWLFTNQEYIIPNNLQKGIQKQVEDIVIARDKLRRQGKQLIVLPIPMKADIYSEQTNIHIDQRAYGLYDTFIKCLQMYDIETVSLRDAFIRGHKHMSLFLVNDTHWTPAGARLAAQELALQYPQLIGDTVYNTTQIDEKSHRGDLVNYLQFPSSLAPHMFAEIKVPIYETTPQSEQSLINDEILFGKQKSNLALIGTSYSKTETWNFAGFLRDSLQNDMENFSLEAYGPFQSMDAFLSNKELLEDLSIHTVIWEFPLRTLLVQQMRGNAPVDPEQHL
jgi:hypothetical protein